MAPAESKITIDNVHYLVIHKVQGFFAWLLGPRHASVNVTIENSYSMKLREQYDRKMSV